MPRSWHLGDGSRKRMTERAPAPSAIRRWRRQSRALALGQRRRWPAELEHRRPLGRERRPPFGEIRSQGDSLGERAKPRRLLAHPGGDRIDGALAAADRGLAEFGEPARIAKHGFLERCLDPPVDEPDRQRLVGFDPPAGEKEILGPRRADQLDEPAGLGMTINEAEPGGSDGKVRVGGAEPQIAGERETKPAPDRDAADDADRRAIELHQRPEGVLDRIAIIARRRGVAVNLVEFGNVGAGAEMRAFALDERDQNVLARLDRRADCRQRPPHRPRDCVATLRAVENDAGERRLEAQGNIGHEVLEARRTRRFRPSLALLRTETDGAERRWGGSLRPGARGAELSDRTALIGVTARAI